MGQSGNEHRRRKRQQPEAYWWCYTIRERRNGSQNNARRITAPSKVIGLRYKCDTDKICDKPAKRNFVVEKQNKK